MPSLQICEAALNVTWSIHRPVISNVVRAEILSHHWTKELGLYCRTMFAQLHLKKNGQHVCTKAQHVHTWLFALARNFLYCLFWLSDRTNWIIITVLEIELFGEGRISNSRLIDWLIEYQTNNHNGRLCLFLLNIVRVNSAIHFRTHSTRIIILIATINVRV